MKKKIYVVPHSHWDREWYFSIEDSNILLYQNLNFLIKFLKKNNDFPTYVFDGQYSIVEEFNKYAPEEYENLRQLVVNNRIHIGPWYTQCDTLLIQTESIIRNLLFGKKGATELGKSMEIGYLPDVFGQNAYLPAIFREMGIKYVILQRGIYTDKLKKDLTFEWESPNGQKILSNNLFMGYGPGKFLSANREYVNSILLPILDKLSKMTNVNNPILLPAGGDQVLVRTQFPKIVDELNSMDLDYEFILSDYETFMSKVSNITNNKIVGELIASQNSRIHSTIRSQRIDIKMLNSRVEEKIYQQLEPLSVMYYLMGGSYPRVWLEKIFKLLFDVQAHDSIGGCNSDETNRNIIQRLEKIQNIIDDNINILKKYISQNVAHRNNIVVFNFLPKNIIKTIKITVFTQSDFVILKDHTGKELPQVLFNQEYISGGKKIVVDATGEKEIKLPGYYRNEIYVRPNFAGLGYQELQVVEKNIQRKINVTQSTYIENKFYRIFVEDGSLKLYRKSDKKLKENWIKFENTLDGGDSYDYSPIEGDVATYNGNFNIVEIRQSDIVSEMVLETSLLVRKNMIDGSETDKLINIETIIQLYGDSDLIRIKHKICNNVKNHRVRVIFEGKNNEGYSYGDQGYSLQKRSNYSKYLSNWKNEGFSESPQPIYPLERFVTVNEKFGNVTLLTKGLKEYEATDCFIALTLYRSVGVLGRDNLAWRPGRASGINNKIVKTPDAQLLKDLYFEYGYRWKEGMFDEKDLYTLAEEFSEYQLGYQLQELNNFEERLDRFEIPNITLNSHSPMDNFFTIQEDIFITSLKCSEDLSSVVARVFNPQNENISVKGELKKGILMNLLEEKKDIYFNELKSKDFATIDIDFIKRS